MSASGRCQQEVPLLPGCRARWHPPTDPTPRPLRRRCPQANGEWSLFCPNESPGLADCWGEEFEALYSRYEREGRARKVIKAQQLWFAILEAQVETGNPFMLYKDSANRKSNQQNLGTIKSSNLCTGGATAPAGDPHGRQRRVF